MKRKKQIMTRQNKKMKWVDLGLIIACLIYAEVAYFLIHQSEFIFGFIINFFQLFFSILGMIHSFTGVLSVLFLIVILLSTIFFVLLLYTFPANIIVYAIRSAYKKRLKENTTYTPVQNITYYRDLFKGLSPAVMSILVNLKIEHKKDRTATLLKLYQRKKSILSIIKLNVSLMIRPI